MENIIARIAVILVGLLALAGVVAGVSGLMQSNTASRVDTDVASILNQARGAFASGPTGYSNFTTANISSLVNAGVFPSDMVVGSAVTDPWGNSLTLASANGGTQGVLTFGGGGSESVATCSKAATGIKDYVTLKVGTTTFTPALPPDAVTAAQACTTGLTFVLTFQ